MRQNVDNYAEILAQWFKTIFKWKRCLKKPTIQDIHMFTYTGGKP